jgi:hypothetical protein
VIGPRLSYNGTTVPGGRNHKDSNAPDRRGRAIVPGIGNNGRAIGPGIGSNGRAIGPGIGSNGGAIVPE